MVSVIQHDQNVACKDLRQFQESSIVYFGHPVSKQSNCRQVLITTVYTPRFAAAAAAKSLQSCPTL